jgi:putative DNA primase/helicase
MRAAMSTEPVFAVQPTEHMFRLTDLGNAERLVAQHGADIRYAPGIGWLAWDGRRWKRDGDGELMRRAKRTVRAMYEEAGRLDDQHERKALLKHALASESEARLQAAVSLAKNERPVIVEADRLDADPWLFNAVNGTIDLQTGQLHEHCRDDLLTRITDVVYRPDAHSDIWDSSIKRVTGGDSELAGFLQRAFGYSLTGHTTEEKLFFVHGPAATGKTTTLEAIRLVLGEYSATADFETFLRRRGDAGIRNDVARLAGARLVISVEVDDGKALAEGLLKVLTGGDTVAARFLYRETFEFQPRFKLWLAANTRPRVSADDTAMWRRILQVPFVQVIPEAERDERVKIALRTDRGVQSAILAWGVQGCLAWQRDGLNVPQSVLDYTAEYRAENDPLRDWLTDCCELAANEWTATKDLRESYDAWCAAAGEKPMHSKTFATHLKAKGLNEHRTTSARGWLGITMTDDAK